MEVVLGYGTVVTRNSGDILEHYGVKGMKWGVRRYQNSDGTYTSTGRERHRLDMERARGGGSEKLATTHKRTSGSSRSVTQKNPSSDDAERAERRKKILLAAGITAATVATAAAIYQNPAIASKAAQVGKKAVQSSKNMTLAASRVAAQTGKAFVNGMKAAAFSGKNAVKSGAQKLKSGTRAVLGSNSPLPLALATAGVAAGGKSVASVGEKRKKRSELNAAQAVVSNPDSSPEAVKKAEREIKKLEKELKITSGSTIKHYGILGMKWGVRRYQNKDGSLTSAGKSRYSEKKEHRQNQKAIEKDRRDALRNISELSDAELDARIRRAEKENKLKQLTYAKTRGKNFAEQALAQIGTKALTAAVVGTTVYGLKRAIGPGQGQPVPPINVKDILQEILNKF